MDRFRTDVENLFLSEMVEEDRDFIMTEDMMIEGIIPANNRGLFDDSSSGDDLEDLLDLDEDELDLF